MNLELTSRDFSKPVYTGLLSFQVEHMAWSVEGGPESARVRVDGPAASIRGLAQLLRCGATVTDESGSPAWWGYVDEVELHLDGAIYTVGLEGLANRVAVRWRDENPLTGAVEAFQYVTPWEVNTYSAAQFGSKEMIFDIGEARQAEALAARKSHLQRRQLPTARSRSGPRLTTPDATAFGVLRLRGWWNTLGWRFYSHNRGHVGNIEWAGVAYSWGHAAGIARVAQTFYCPGSSPWSAREVWLRLYRVGNPADTVTVELCQYTAGGPGTVYATATLAGSALEREASGWVQLQFSAGYVMTPGTYYTLQVRRSGAVDAANYYGVRTEEGVKLSNGMIYYNGSAWAARSPNSSLVMGLYGEESTTEQIKNIAASGAGGQFLAGVMVKQASGINTRMARAGKLSALEELQALLALGTNGGETLHGRITAERWLVVDKRPAAESVDLLIRADGSVWHESGRRLLAGELPVGKWARVESLSQAGGDVGAAAVVFIDRAVWEECLRVGWE
jgi:hypothetical protein